MDWVSQNSLNKLARNILRRCVNLIFWNTLYNSMSHNYFHHKTKTVSERPCRHIGNSRYYSTHFKLGTQWKPVVIFMQWPLDSSLPFCHSNTSGTHSSLFPKTVLVLWVLKGPVPVSVQYFKKYDISDNANAHFDFPTVGWNVHSSRTAISQLPTARTGEGQEDVWIGDCRVWTEPVKGECQICKVNWGSEWVIIFWILLFQCLYLFISVYITPVLYKMQEYQDTSCTMYTACLVLDFWG